LAIGMELIDAYNYSVPDPKTAERNIRKSMLNDPYWTTRDGIKLYPFQMRDSHLVKTIEYLERKYGEDMRPMVVRHLLKLPLKKNERIQIELIEENLLIYIKLIEEALKRGLFRGIQFSFETWEWQVNDLSLQY
jgi:hypothetical protein